MTESRIERHRSQLDGLPSWTGGGYSTGMPLAESVPQLDEVRVLDGRGQPQSRTPQTTGIESGLATGRLRLQQFQ